MFDMTKFPVFMPIPQSLPVQHLLNTRVAGSDTDQESAKEEDEGLKFICGGRLYRWSLSSSGQVMGVYQVQIYDHYYYKYIFLKTNRFFAGDGGELRAKVNPCQQAVSPWGELVNRARFSFPVFDLRFQIHDGSDGSM